MSRRYCDTCGAEFDTLTRLRLHQQECNQKVISQEDTRVTALSKVGTGSQFQSIRDRRKNRLREHGIESIEEAVQRLRKSISDFGVDEFIEELWYHELIRATSYEVLDEDTGIPPKMVEYLFGLSTTIPEENTDSSAGFYDVIQSASLVYDKLRSEQNQRLAEADSLEDRRKAHVQSNQLERELTTGRFAHGAQRKEFVLRGFSTIDEELEEILGFTATESVNITESILQYHKKVEEENPLVTIAQHVMDLGEGPFQVSYQEAMANGLEDPKSGLPTVWVEVAKFDNHRFNPLKSEYSVGDFSKYETDFGSIRTVTPNLWFGPSDISGASDGELTHLDTYLDELSIEFGEYDKDPKDRSGSYSKFDYPFEHNPIHQFPLLRNQQGKYHIGPQNSLWYSLSTRFRYDILGSDYEGSATQKLGTSIEAWIEECLENINDGNIQALSGVEYELRESDSILEVGESDIVLISEGQLIVIEIKTRGLRLGSRLGPYTSFEEIREDAEEVIEEPYKNQAMKLINGIKNGQVTELRGRDGMAEVASDDFSNYVPVVVVAQPLDFVGTILYADLIDFSHEKPYITDIYSIQTLCRTLADSGKFLEYINKRVEVGSSGRAFSIDEIDYLGEFIENGLEYPDVPDGRIVEIIHSGSHLEDQYETSVGSRMSHL